MVKKFKDVIKTHADQHKQDIAEIKAKIPGMVVKLEALAEKYIEKRDATWDSHSQKVFDSDAQDMLHIARCLGKGYYQEAIDRMFNLDTAVREDLPNDVYQPLIKMYNVMGLR